MKDYMYRAWYVPGKVMVYQEWSDEHNTYIFPELAQGIVKKYLSSYVAGSRRNFRTMIYTEIKDRNGRDIFEQDIVRRWVDDKELPPVVVDHSPQFWWDNVDTTAYEIIGNTFENPELIPKPLT